jgi:hypothetical protein
VGDLWLLAPTVKQCAKMPAEALLLILATGLFCWAEMEEVV